jgi:hypothetical protein
MINPSDNDWEQVQEETGHARERAEFFLRENPIPVIIGALGLGLTIGWALHHALSSEHKHVDLKTGFDKINWGVFTLPFLWPTLKTVRGRCADSAESVKHGVNRLKNIDLKTYAKPIRKRWKAWTR